MLILDGSRGLSVPEGVMDVTTLVDEIEVEDKDITFELLLFEVNAADSEVETDEEVLTVEDDWELDFNDEEEVLMVVKEDEELVFDDEEEEEVDVREDDEDDDTAP